MQWIVNLEGGPRRVNHAAVALGKKIYSFGGYSSEGIGDGIDVHVLDTYTFRWRMVPAELLEQHITQQSSIASNLSLQTSFSGSSSLPHWRAHTLPKDPSPLKQMHQPSLPPIIQTPNNSQSSTVDSVSMMDLEWSNNPSDEDLDTDADDEDSMYVYGLEVQFEFINGNSAPLISPRPNIPTQRYGHTVVAWKGCAYLWGGRQLSTHTHNNLILLHEYNPVTNHWAIVDTQGEIPTARDGHITVVHDDTMYIFGGFQEQIQRFSREETFAFHFSTKQWSKLRTEGDPPQYRDFHAACVLNGKMYVFGGRTDLISMIPSNEEVYYDKLNCLDLKTKHWNEVATYGQGPCGRRSHTMWTYDGCLYLFGGYRGQTRTNPKEQHFNDLYMWNPSTNEWRELRPGGMGPSTRRRQCTVMVGSRLFLFGGIMSVDYKTFTQLEELGDLHVLDFSPTLTSLCAKAVIKQGEMYRYGHLLPYVLWNELHYMSAPNTISTPRSFSLFLFP